jgi:hypothetical protein
VKVKIKKLTTTTTTAMEQKNRELSKSLTQVIFDTEAKGWGCGLSGSILT